MIYGPTVGVDEAAIILKVHPKTVLELIATCAIPAAKEGRAWVMMTSDVVGHIQTKIAKQTALRMRQPPKAKSPKLCGQVATS